MRAMQQRSKSSSAMPTPKPVYKGFVTLTEEEIVTPDGPYPYITVHTKPFSVIVLPLRSDGKWLVTKEWRYPMKRYVYSFPGGLVDDGESPLQTAQRELLEETGFKAEKVELLGTCFPLPGLLHQTMSVMLAKGIQHVQEPKSDGVEKVTWEFYSMEELQKLFCSSSDLDAMGLAALGLYWMAITKK